MKVRWMILLALGLLGAAAFVPFIKTTTGATTVTGTIVTTQSWFGLPPVAGKQESPLAKWCHARGVPVTEDTVFFSRITKNAWGGVWARNDGLPPACRDFIPDMQKAWLARASEPEVLRFIEAMTATDETGRARLVDAAVARASASR